MYSTSLKTGKLAACFFLFFFADYVKHFIVYCVYSFIHEFSGTVWRKMSRSVVHATTKIIFSRLELFQLGFRISDETLHNQGTCYQHLVNPQLCFWHHGAPAAVTGVAIKSLIRITACLVRKQEKAWAV